MDCKQRAGHTIVVEFQGFPDTMWRSRWVSVDSIDHLCFALCCVFVLGESIGQAASKNCVFRCRHLDDVLGIPSVARVNVAHVSLAHVSVAHASLAHVSVLMTAVLGGTHGWRKLFILSRMAPNLSLSLISILARPLKTKSKTYRGAKTRLYNTSTRIL